MSLDMMNRVNNLENTNPKILISIIIPTLNGEASLPDLFAALKKQSRQPDEVLVVDSSSTDKSVQIARSHGAIVKIIPSDEFDHGGTRSKFGRLATGDILVYMTQDAVPVDEFSLERLIQPFFDDDNLAVTYGRQLPNHDASLFAAHIRLFNYGKNSYTRNWEDRKQFGLRTAFVSNSFAAYRKNALAACNYFQDGLLFGEDTCAVTQLLKNDFSITYVADSQVYHSHNYTVFQDFKRYFDIGAFHRRQKWLLDTLGRPEGEGFRYLCSELDFLLRKKKFLSFPEFLLRIGGKLLGYKLGGRYTLLPKRIVLLCSMNRRFWLK